MSTIEEIRAMDPQTMKELNDRLALMLAKTIAIRIGVVLAVHLAAKGLDRYLARH